MVDKHVVLRFPDKSDRELKVNYRTVLDGDLHIIECKVSNEHAKPGWLQLEKFNFTSLKMQGVYNLLFEERKFDKNLETVLFMDEVYARIMAHSNYKIA